MTQWVSLCVMGIVPGLWFSQRNVRQAAVLVLASLVGIPFSSGLLPAECDKRFLDIACRLDRYGMDFHPVLVSLSCLSCAWSVAGVSMFPGYLQHPTVSGHIC